MFCTRYGTDWFYKPDPDCAAAAAYVTGDLTGTLCSLTKAFLFRSISGEHPESHSWRMSGCPSAEEEVNKVQRAFDRIGIVTQEMEKLQMIKRSITKSFILNHCFFVCIFFMISCLKGNMLECRDVCVVSQTASRGANIFSASVGTNELLGEQVLLHLITCFWFLMK